MSGHHPTAASSLWSTHSGDGEYEDVSLSAHNAGLDGEGAFTDTRGQDNYYDSTNDNPDEGYVISTNRDSPDEDDNLDEDYNPEDATNDGKPKRVWKPRRRIMIDLYV